MKAAAATLAALTALAILAVVFQGSSQPDVELAQFAPSADRLMRQRILGDRLRLAMDQSRYSQMLRAQKLATYGDGCKCECPSSGCDEEKHQGPVCSCPGEKAGGMPSPMAPFNFDRTARGRRVGMLRSTGAVLPPFMHRSARTQKKWVGSPPKYLPPDGDYPGGSTGVPLDGYLAYETGWGNDGPFHGELAPLQEAGIAKSPVAQTLRQMSAARTQKKWVGSPPKYLPPDGDYPGGSTGVPLDGYLAYETGWGNDGPFHGELAPLQEAGIAKSPVAQTLRQMSAARTQKKWVGSPPKYLPPDGDYPGGSTGVPLDGYLAYETGWGNDGPFHGELAPLQEAGIAKSPVAQTLQQVSKRGWRHAARMQQRSLLGGAFDEQMPANSVPSSLFARSSTNGATLSAVDQLF